MSIIILFNELPFILIFLHLSILFSLYFLTYVFCQTVLINAPLVKILLFSLVSFFIFWLYILNTLALNYWGSTVTFSFIWLYLCQINSLLEDIPFALLLVLIVAISVFCLFFKFYNRHVVFSEAKPSWGDFKVYYIFSFVVMLNVFISFDPKDPKIWEGEFITNLVLNSTGIHHLYTPKILIPIKKNDKKIRPNIIYIHLDAMRSDHMSAYGYYRNTTPYIDKLLEHGAEKITVATSICSESICGMVAALGSNFIDKLPNKFELLHHQLKKYGYKNNFIGVGNFSWGGFDNIIQGGIDLFSRSDQQSDYSIHDDFYIINELNKLPQSKNKENFFFLRYLSSHPIGKHFNRYRKYTPSQKNVFSYLLPSLDDEVAINAYDNNTLQADDLVQRSLSILKAKGYLENYILVIYGDHGDALGEHGYFGHYTGLYQEEIGVPMIFASNKAIGLSLKEYASILDIAPTILDFVDIPIPKQYIGISLFSEVENHPLTFHSSRTGVYSVIYQTNNKLYKYIYYRKAQKANELYELFSDPKERNNVIGSVSGNISLYLEEQLIGYFQLETEL